MKEMIIFFQYTTNLCFPPGRVSILLLGHVATIRCYNFEFLDGDILEGAVATFDVPPVCSRVLLLHSQDMSVGEFAKFLATCHLGVSVA